MKITAVGDCSIQKNLPRYYDGFEEIRSYIMRGDVRFFNLETTVCEDCFAAKYSGGTWLRADKTMLSDLLEYGFNTVTFANNHSMDFSYNGFMQTVENIKRAGLKGSGFGRSLAEAAAPVYIDTPNGRAAVISCTTSYSPGAEAGEQSRDLPGRPGVNPIELKKVVYAGEQELKALSDIAEKTGLNSHDRIRRKEGYLAAAKEGEVDFGGVSFRLGEPRTRYEISETDLARIKNAIKDAGFQADVVLISVHSHQTEEGDKEIVPEFLSGFAHACIDAGAHAVIGHGPHLVRPFEIYKGLPIFYSLGNFIMQLENCPIVPYDYYEKFGLTPDAGIYEVFKKRTKNFTVGLQRQKEMTESIIPCFEITDGKLEGLEFMSVELGFGIPHSGFGWPRAANDDTIIKKLYEMSNIKDI